jgi:hypothetical protein
MVTGVSIALAVWKRSTQKKKVNFGRHDEDGGGKE